MFTKSDAVAFLESIDGPLTIPQMVVSTRQCDGYTRASMARKLGCTAQYLCDVEKGRRVVTPVRAYRWAELLGYSGHLWYKVASEDRARRELAQVGQEVEGLEIGMHPHAA
jgi:transcriptional regulator with XRE-family HTH domain